MAVYVMAQLSFTDRAAYDRYQQRFMGVMNLYKGQLLAADERPRVLEGKWDYEKVVLMCFPDEAAFNEWAQSPEYQEIAKDRRAGANTLALLVQGI